MNRLALAFLVLMPALFSCGAEGGMLLWDVAGQEEVTLSGILPELKQNSIVYVGEEHDVPEHHAVQLEVIKSLHESGADLAVGLEMFIHRDQNVLNRWVTGDLDEEGMEGVFMRNWGHMWKLYQDIFMYCRMNGIPMLGLNVPREITRQVARQGFESLTEEQVAELPMVTCQVDPEYERFLRRVMGGHNQGENFQNFCEAQLVWDTSMAVYSLEYLKENPEKTMVVILGTVHAWKKAVPRQVERLSPRKIDQEVMLPDTPGEQEREEVLIDDCDYLILGMGVESAE
ncbi:MAG: ChaN family lipoprotein [Desulfovibrionales bacterium]